MTQSQIQKGQDMQRRNKKMESNDLSSIQEKAQDVLSQAGWLIWMEVCKVIDDDATATSAPGDANVQDNFFRVQVEPTCTVEDVKKEITKRWNILEKNQFITVPDIGNKPIFNGRVVDLLRRYKTSDTIDKRRNKSSTSVTGNDRRSNENDVPVIRLTVQKKIWDPLLESQMEIASIIREEEDERDELLQAFMVQRLAKHDYDGYPLQVVENQTSTLHCHKCFLEKHPDQHITVGRQVQQMHVGQQRQEQQQQNKARNDIVANVGNEASGRSNSDTASSSTRDPSIGENPSYVLCTSCYEADAGQKMSSDPYKDLADLATTIARQHAAHAAWFGGWGHMCGHPSVCCTGDVVPKSFRIDRLTADTGRHRDGRRRRRQSSLGIKTNRDVPVFHKGVRLKVLLHDDVKKILEEIGVTDWQTVETDMVVENENMILQNFFRYRNKLKSSEKIWHRLRDELKERHGQFDEEPVSYTAARLDKYALQEIVYVVQAYVRDGDY